MADAMYIYLREGKVAKTKEVNDHVFVDVDSNNDIIGIEMIGVSEQIPKHEIGRIETQMPVYAEAHR